MGYTFPWILFIVSLLMSTYASAQVRSQFNKYAQVRDMSGLTGAQAAQMMLNANGLSDVQLKQVPGVLTDHYDPTTRTLSLSESVCNQASISAVAVACHEVGHAIQHAQGYDLLRIRNNIVPIANIASRFTWLLVMAGIMIMSAGNNYYGFLVFDIGVVAFFIVLLFHLVTLPVEFDASNRALANMTSLNIVYGDETQGAKKVLSAAALTYVAALATSIATLLRLLAMRNSGRR